MASFMKPFSGHTYSALRFMAGFMFFWHGTQLLFGFPAPPPPGATAVVIYVAGGIELVGGALVAIGLFTRWAAFFCSGLMAAAYWIAHGRDNLFPSLNGGELSALYCFVFLFISAHGAGLLSLDALRGGDNA